MTQLDLLCPVCGKPDESRRVYTEQELEYWQGLCISERLYLKYGDKYAKKNGFTKDRINKVKEHLKRINWRGSIPVII